MAARRRRVSAQPASEPGGDGPAEILALLPQRWHEQFLGEYRAALTRWRLRAAAYSDPGFDAAARAAREARAEDLTPVPGLAGWR
jgi:hypothetical protein